MPSEVGQTLERFDVAKAAAIEAGLRIVVADDSTLQLDLDSEDAFAYAKSQLRRFSAELGVLSASMTRSRNGNYHVYVRLGVEMDRTARILWQAVLGSDRTREGLNALWSYEDEPCVFFEANAEEPLDYSSDELDLGY